MGSSSTSWSSESNTHAGTSKVYSSSTWDAIVSTDGLKINASEAATAQIELWADEGDDNADKWKWQVADGGSMTWQSYTSGSYATKLTLSTGGNLTVTGASQLNSTLTVGVDDTGYDVKFFGATASSYMLWDESADGLIITNESTGRPLTLHTKRDDVLLVQSDDNGCGIDIRDNVGGSGGASEFTGMFAYQTSLRFRTDNSDRISILTDGKVGIGTTGPATTLHVIGDFRVGVDDTGHDVIFYGATASRYWTWNEASDSVRHTDNVSTKWGSSNDLIIVHDGSDNKTYFNVYGGTASVEFATNSDASGKPINIGHTTSETTINDNLTVTGTLIGGRSSVESVTADDTLTAAESGKIFVFADAAAVLTLPDSGAGDIIGVTFTFISNFQGTGQEVKCTDTSNEIIVGNLIGADDDGDGAPLSWNAQVSDGYSSIEFTSVADGKIGSFFKVTCYATDRWLVQGVVNQSGGSEATPFAAS